MKNTLVIVNEKVYEQRSSNEIYSVEVYKNGDKVERFTSKDEVEDYFDIEIPDFSFSNTVKILKYSIPFNVVVSEMNVS